jgi:hypothetical protein
MPSNDVTVLEIIDGLCKVTETLAQLVNKQAEVIAQADIAEEIKEELETMRNGTDLQMDVLEYKMRKIL